MSHFEISIEISAVLSVDEIWPDGDAPEEPTVEDVEAAIRGYGPTKQMADDWELWSGDVGLNARKLAPFVMDEATRQAVARVWAGFPGVHRADCPQDASCVCPEVTSP